jgi:hypothetical protein
LFDEIEVRQHSALSQQSSKTLISSSQHLEASLFSEEYNKTKVRKEKCHAESMMSNETSERLKRDTQDVPLRKSVEEKVRGMGLKAVWPFFFVFSPLLSF